MLCISYIKFFINLKQSTAGCLPAVLSALRDMCHRRFITEYRADMTALNCLAPSAEPKATEHIPQMISMIESIMKSGHAYETEGSVWFSVESIEGYGRLSGRSLVRLPCLCAVEKCGDEVYGP